MPKPTPITKPSNLLLLALFLCGTSILAATPSKPNIVLIMVDDMGFSDIGCYGSEIPTPNIDALAAGGLRFTQFYNTARCSPTRAALVTGLNPHQAGMGRLAEEMVGLDTQAPAAYLGYLNDQCVTLAEVLRPAGYHTYLAGKWHLGQRDEAKWPLQRGFDRFYGILPGSCSYLRPEGERPLCADNRILPAPTDPDYYTTDAFTDFAIQTVRETKTGEAFFLYLAFNAPHWPLHAKPDDIARFVGKYRAGWDELRLRRLNKMKALGIFEPDLELSERDSGVRAWGMLTEQQQIDLDYRMAVYAAQVYRVDWNIGRLVDTLRERGELDDTLIVFLSDNGASAERYSDLGSGEQQHINDPAVRTCVSYGQGWANVSATPFRRFKSHLHEGGIATPLIIHWPAGLKRKPGSLDATVGYLTDIMPTFVDVGGAAYPSEYDGHAITPLDGHSLLPILSGSSRAPSEPRVLCWEQYGFKAIRVGDLKAVFSPKDMYDGRNSDRWELYDLARDRTELHDLAAERPAVLNGLIARWDEWAARVQVEPAPAQTAATPGSIPARSK